MKKIFIIFFILVLLVSIGTIYLNQVVLPVKIKSLIIGALEDETHKKASLKSLQFNIFKGLVLKNLVLYDGTKTVISLKEVSCTFLVWPFFKKQIIIPTVRLKSPVIFLERRADNTFNLFDLFPQDEKGQAKRKFSLFVYAVSVTDGRINFQDDTLNPAFTKTIDNLSLAISFSLPNSIKFNLKSEIPSQPKIKISAQGEFKIPQQQLLAKIDIVDFSPREFSGYYQNFGISPVQGYLDASCKLNSQDNIISADLEAQSRNLIISKDKITAKLNSGIIANLEYRLKDKQLKLSGKVDLAESRISGLAFKEIQAKANLSFALETKIPAADSPEINGWLNILDAGLKSEKFVSPLEKIAGRIEFSPNQLVWSDLNFKYADVPYKTSGRLTDFKAPGIELELSSPDLSLESILAINDKVIRLTKCAGRYLHSEFSVVGNLDTQDPAKLEAEINAGLNINLEDIKGRLQKFKDQLEKIAPKGRVDVKLNLAGNLNEIKACAIQARLASSTISAYGLKSGDFFMEYNQADGLIDIPAMHLSLYDGTLDASAKINLSSPNLPYWADVNIQGVKIEKLKLDTAAKEKDISGIFKAQAKINGFSGDFSKLSGIGEIFITEGNLWQLNLFKGLGALLFTRDFTSIIFRQGYCGFSIQDKSIFTDNLKLESNLVNLTGSAKIGFDSSIDALLNVQVSDEAPLSGTFKDVTTAIMGEVGRFGSIKVSGTLKEPKYKFKAAVFDIIKGLKNIFFKE